MEALSWPKHSQRPGPLAHFCQDFPLFGLNSKTRRALRRQQARRPKHLPSAVWGPDADRARIALEVSELVRRHCSWPNASFIPEDPCEIVISDSCDGFQSLCALMELSKRSGISTEELQGAAGATFGSFVDFIQTKSRK
jgi:hypothetical protein